MWLDQSLTCMLHDIGAALGDHQARVPPIFTGKIFQSPLLALMPILQFIYKSKMSILSVCVTVKIQFDNASTCKYSPSAWSL